MSETAFIALAFATFAACRWTRLGCFVGVHGRAGDWEDTGEEPDEGGRIYLARRCERCRSDVQRIPLRSHGPFANGTIYGPE